MIPPVESPRQNPEELARAFIEEVKLTSERIAQGKTNHTRFLSLFVGLGQDMPSVLKELGEDGYKTFSPQEAAAIFYGKQILGNFSRNFGYDRQAWGTGLTDENRFLKEYFTSTAKVVLAILDKNSPYNKDLDEHLIAIHENYSLLISWVGRMPYLPQKSTPLSSEYFKKLVQTGMTDIPANRHLLFLEEAYKAYEKYMDESAKDYLGRQIQALRSYVNPPDERR